MSPSPIPQPPGPGASLPGTPAQDSLPAQGRRDDICVHIFTASATLIGVCLTVIGVMRIVRRLNNVSTIADALLSVDAVGYLVACVVSYGALRTADASRRRRIERYADIAFLVALALMTAVCALLALELV